MTKGVSENSRNTYVRRRPRGRPSTFTPAIGRQICEMVSDGLPQSVAARILSIPDNTISSWYGKGCDDIEAGKETPLANFARDLNEARGKSIYRHVKYVNRSAEGGQLIREKTGIDHAGNEFSAKAWTAPDWRASAHMLSVIDPDHFAARNRVEHSGTIKLESLQVSLSGKLDEAQLVALARLVHAVGDQPTWRDIEQAGAGQQTPFLFIGGRDRRQILNVILVGLANRHGPFCIAIAPV